MYVFDASSNALKCTLMDYSLVDYLTINPYNGILKYRFSRMF
jgi:hypothetical protein